MKKIINLLIIAIAVLCLAGCNTKTDNGDNPGTGNTDTPVTYPYMDYFENTVYAMKFGGKDGRDGPVHGVYKDSNFVAIGQASMSDVTASTPYSFNDKEYGGLCFTAKTGIELETVTFTIVAEKECYIGIRLFGPELDENDNPGFNNTNVLKVVNSVVEFKNSNFTTLDGRKFIKLSPNTPLTFTVDTYAEDGERSTYSEAADFGKITDACAEDDTARRFLLSIMPYIIKNGYTGSQFTNAYFEENDLGIRLYNISFDVKKI